MVQIKSPGITEYFPRWFPQPLLSNPSFCCLPWKFTNTCPYSRDLKNYLLMSKCRQKMSPVWSFHEWWPPSSTNCSFLGIKFQGYQLQNHLSWKSKRLRLSKPPTFWTTAIRTSNQFRQVASYWQAVCWNSTFSWLFWPLTSFRTTLEIRTILTQRRLRKTLPHLRC